MRSTQPRIGIQCAVQYPFTNALARSRDLSTWNGAVAAVPPVGESSFSGLLFFLSPATHVDVPAGMLQVVWGMFDCVSEASQSLSLPCHAQPPCSCERF